MVIPAMSGASLTSSVVVKPSADAVSLSDVLLSETAEVPDADDVLLSETAEAPDADDVLLPVDAVLPQAVSDIAAARKSAAHFFSFLSFFPVIFYSFPKKKPLPYGSSPFSFFAASYCTYLFSSAFTICWNSSFA